jgi:hypothetical protein
VIRRLIRFFFRVDAGGGKLPAYRPRPGERLVVLSPGGRIDDPDEAEVLGMSTAAVRRIGRQADV